MSDRSHSEQVRRFFDALAPTYRDRYGKTQPFLAYFHRQRLEEATRPFSFTGKRVLDIGAGTGQLYEFLLEKEPAIDYYACDLSVEMKKHSRVPPERYFVGQATALHFPADDFDLVFVLGVTTYLSRSENDRLLQWIVAHLRPGGQAVLSFTHRRSLDYQLRRLFRAFGWGRKDGRSLLLGQRFPISAFSLPEARTLMNDQFQVEQVAWLNQTIFPFNRLFPRWSIWLARRWRRPAPWASSDFLLFLSRQQ